MKSLLFKRIGAYVFDLIIVSMIVSIVTYGFKNDSSFNEIIANNRIKDLISETTDVNSSEEIFEEVAEISYQYQKSIVPIGIVNVMVSIGYFIIFAFLNGGQTIGKKLFRVCVVNKDGGRPNIWNMVIRSMFLYGILSDILNIFIVGFNFNVKTYIYTNAIINYLYLGFIFICLFMLIYRKDGRGLHDIIGSTKVIGEVR